MVYDLLFRGGRVYDGSGQPSYLADVAVKDGKIVELGRIRGGAARTIDVAGLAVAPGFIDHHTHMDAQVFWDPHATSEPQHGVTSVITGNCGLALAPVKRGDEDAILKKFVRVEAMPRHALEKGVPWGWHSYGDYLNRLEGRLGLNVGGLVGHIAVRQYVLGEESVEREATAEEIQRMRQLVQEGMEAGALGFSTNRNERHMREDGKPVPSRLASDEELFALCDVLGEVNAGAIQSTLGQFTFKHYEMYHYLARRTQRPVIGQTVMYRPNHPERWKQQLDAIAPMFREGHRTYLRTHTVPNFRSFTLSNAQAFDEFPTWKSLMFMDLEARKKGFVDPRTRQKLREDLADPRPTNFHRNWNLVTIEKVVKPENQKYVGQSVAKMAEMRGQDSLDALLDLSLEEDLETTFRTANAGGNAEAMREILKSPYILVGNSDAGAHVQYNAEFGYGTTLLGLWVREQGVLSLEQAIYKLTFQVASVYGIEGRGLVKPGYAADLAVFDPQTINACEPEWAEDYPAGTKRLIQRAVGMHFTVVNGRVICEEGKVTGELAGQVLRNSGYGTGAAAAA
jgi:N-acyl-D-aspartate/D-glutamate deacylase